MAFAVTHSYHSKTWYKAFALIALYDNGQSYHVPHLHIPGQHKIHQTQTPAKLAMTTNTAFITQAVLCEAPYSIIHAQHKKSWPLTYNSALVVQRTDWCSLRRPCSYHFPLPNLKLHHLQMKSRKCVSWQLGLPHSYTRGMQCIVQWAWRSSTTHYCSTALHLPTYILLT